MNYRYIFLILILLCTGAVYADCIGYLEKLNVRVLDAKYRAVEGAEVVVTFDRGSSFGDVYFTTEPRTTDENGMINYTIQYQSTNTRTIDCNIQINVSAGGSEATATAVADEHGSIVDVQITDLYLVKFYVKDQFSVAIENSTVSIDEWEPVKTGGNGIVSRYLKAGDHEYFVSYKDASLAGLTTVEDDVYLEIIFPHYPVTIEVTDDLGDPINATINIFNETFVMENGRVEYEEVYGEQIPYSIEYMGVVKDGVIELENEPLVQIRYDTHAPQITSVESQSEGNKPKLSITVEDNGIYADGLDVTSMKVTYNANQNESEEWYSAVVFTTGKDRFAAEFPEMESNTIVNFKIEVRDNAGNLAQVEGSFTTMVIEIPQNETQNSSNTQVEPPKDQGIPLLYIIGGVILLILAFYVVIRIKTKARDGVS